MKVGKASILFYEGEMHMKKTLVLSLFMILSSPTPLYAATPQLNVSAMKLYVGNRYTFKVNYPRLKSQACLAQA